MRQKLRLRVGGKQPTTKGKDKTRIVDIPLGLAAILDEYKPKKGAMFPNLS